MSGNIDILQRLPDVAAIGRAKLQSYCSEWLLRPIARQFGVTHLFIGSDLLLTVNVDPGQVDFFQGRAFIPLEELLGYVIDTHFPDINKRHDLHAQARYIWKRWSDVGYQYEVMAGRVGNLWLTCKNPTCGVQLETAQQAVEGQTVHCPPSPLICPACGHTATYDGSDLELRL